MPNDCWQRWESPLEQSEVEAYAVLQASIEQGPLRRQYRPCTTTTTRNKTETKTNTTARLRDGQLCGNEQAFAWL